MWPCIIVQMDMGLQMPLQHPMAMILPRDAYYEWQALSTMDVDCPTWMDWFHGGLQFQLEHHLFPRVPRRHLRALCQRTDAIFDKYNVPVVRIPFAEANQMVLNHMAIVGAKAAKVKSM